MTLANLSLEVGRNLQYLNSDRDAWQTGRGVIEADVKAWINEIYREELFPLLSTRYGYMFKKDTQADADIATGVIETISTTTVNTTTEIFNNSMEEAYVYNATTEDYYQIDSYTDADTVVLTEDVSGDWAIGQTIYVLGKEFVMDGDAEDLYVVKQVEMKYTDDVTNWTPAEKRSEVDLNRFGDESYSTSDPKWYLTTIVDSDVRKWAVGIDPGFTDKDGKIQVTYIEKPETLEDSDSPFIPLDNVLIAGATAKAFRVMQDAEGLSFWEREFLRLRQELLNGFTPTKTGGPARRRQSNRMYRLRGRKC